MSDGPSTDEAPADEVVTGETIIEGERTIRVYGGAKGDFVVTVPDGAKITFGYFNPASPRFESRGGGGWHDGNSNVAVQTALRIYERGEKGNQLACFIGVKGFRDERVKLTNLNQRVILETKFEDDGEGNIDAHRQQRRQLVATPEPDTYT